MGGKNDVFGSVFVGGGLPGEPGGGGSSSRRSLRGQIGRGLPGTRNKLF